MKQQKSGGFNNNITRWIFICVGVIIVCSLISWAMMSSWGAAKAEVSDDLTQLTNDISHVKDSVTGLNNFAGNQTTQLIELQDSTEIHFEQVDSSLNVLDAKSAQLNSDLSDLQAHTDGIAADLDAKTTDIYNQMLGINGQITDANTKIDSVTGTANDTASSLASLASTVSTVQSSVTNLTSNMTITIPSGVINAANCTDRFIWTADDSYEVTKITFQQSVKESTSSTTTLTIRNVPDGYAISSGYTVLDETINLKSGVTANTVLDADLTSTSSYLELDGGDSLALDFTNAITEYVGCVTITLKRV